MPVSVSFVAVVTQSVAAGLVAGLCLLQAIWWRNDRGRSGSGWLLAWTAAIGVLLAVNVALSVLPPGTAYDVVMFARAQVLATCVVLALPTVAAFTGGPPVRAWVLAAAAAFALRAVVWLTTDLVVVASTGASSVRGPLAVPTFFLPLLVVVGYLLRALRSTDDRRASVVIGGTGLVSVALLALPYLAPVGPWTHPLTVTWTLPLVAGLTAVGLGRLATVDRETRRQHALRDALSEASSAASVATEPDGLLQQAETIARRHLGDPTVAGTTRPLPCGRFVTTFERADGASTDPRAAGFLDDLARLVSSAAERITLARDLRQAAFVDSLTGLPNRHALERHLAAAIRTASERNHQLAVLFCDLDGLKIENELHGHAWGDRLLTDAGRHLRATAGEDGVVARFGGDELVVVLAEPGPPEALRDLAWRIRSGLSTGVPDRAVPLLSVGIALWCPESAGAPEHLLRQADAAMLEAKRTRSGVVVFDDALRARMQAEEELRRELDVALVGNELTVHYQPVVDARTLEVVGVEALARWEHGGRLRMPGEWLPFAEDTGLIVPIGRTIVGIARGGSRRMGLPVMVNVAARQLAEPSFVDHVVADWGRGDWGRLTLEITESALLQDMPHVLESLTRLRALGARIAIDDFGTGYSSFARLATLPVDVLKIDRAFVDAVTTDEGAAVVRAIVSLAQAYRLDVVAEGVETLEQLDALVALGVPKLQGFLLGRPAAGRPGPVRLPRPAER
ncbi:putative bifunctional diguanylate cyclase/phosphodiesterase [Cellulomonas aerilata]|nr:EAL domain-containing protein [Cellulomonas aerilata]